MGRTKADSVQQMVQQQADATLSQANPVSATLYTVLDTTKNVRIISIAANITWAVTQPNPLQVVLTIDGKTFIFNVANPVSGTNYMATMSATEDSETAMSMVTATNATSDKPFLLEGRSVRVQARVTWATTQPTPLIVRVKYAKMA